MGQDSDLYFLRWLNSRPNGRGSVKDYPMSSSVDFGWLESSGKVERVSGQADTYQITKDGRHYQEGD